MIRHPDRLFRTLGGMGGLQVRQTPRAPPTAQKPGKPGGLKSGSSPAQGRRAVSSQTGGHPITPRPIWKSAAKRSNCK
eukprot:24746-Prorocentrum_lima.AAC.1